LRNRISSSISVTGTGKDRRCRINYSFSGNDYIYVSNKIKRSPIDFMVYTPQGHVFTSEFLKYYGPNHDFHGSTLTPNDMNVTGLVIKSLSPLNSWEKTFQIEDIIYI
jgi:hypothetical protein